MWRTHLTEPKTAESVAPVPVAETLAEILADTQRDSGFILVSPTGKPVDLHNLAYRIVVPTLTACADCGKPKRGHDAPKLRRAQMLHHQYKPKPLPEWRGWYAFRRGCATLATSLDSSMAAKSLLRHSNVATTESYYIKSVPSEAVRAVEKMDVLFQEGSDSAPI
jgi:integrase